MENLRKGYQGGIRSKGVTVGVGASGGSEQINLAGDAQEFLGLQLLTDQADGFGAATTIRLEINNDMVIDEVDARFLEDSPENPRAFIAYPRPLTGKDDIQIRVNSSVVQNVSVIVYYVKRVTG